MPYLYCAQHGPEREADIRSNEQRYREEGETVLVVHGSLRSGPWLCDRCAGELNKGDEAWLVSAFARHFHDSLCDYEFGYERGYFAMTKRDQATAYGVRWPDDSLRNRRKPAGTLARKPICALDLLGE